MIRVTYGFARACTGLDPRIRAVGWMIARAEGSYAGSLVAFEVHNGQPKAALAYKYRMSEFSKPYVIRASEHFAKQASG